MGTARPLGASYADRMRPQVIFFDVNGTLLDTSAMRSSIAHALGGRTELFQLWLTTLLHCSLVESAIGHFHEFSQLASAALRMVAAQNGLALSDEAAHAAVAPVRSLPAFADVSAGLDALSRRGHTLVALTNSSSCGCTAQLEHSGLAACFHRQLSVQEIRLYKPHTAVYLWAAEQMHTQPEDAWMVAAHGWDLAGAHAAGLHTALVTRLGHMPYPLAPPPDLIVPDIGALARAFQSKAA